MSADKLDQLLHKAKELVAKIEQSRATPRQALTLPAPFAELVAQGQATLVISDTQKDDMIADRPLLLADPERIYGEVRLNKGKPISLAEFRRRSKEHRIPDAERKAAWPAARRLFAYPVESVRPLDVPKRRSAQATPCRGKTKATMVETGLHKRRLTTRQVAAVKKANVDTAVFSEIHGLCAVLKTSAATLATQTIELMDPSPQAQDILSGVSEAAELLGPEFERLAKALDAPGPEAPEIQNPFMLADDLVAAIERAGQVLPEKSRPAALAKAALEPLHAFLELEADFQEGSRCPCELEPVAKQEPTVIEVQTEEVSSDAVFGAADAPDAQQVCVCIVCGYAMHPPPDTRCEDLHCPSCENDMVLTPMRDLAQDQQAAVDITLDLEDTPPVIGSMCKAAMPAGMQIQTLILSKETFESIEDAKRWVGSHDFKVNHGGKGPDETGTSYRFRQRDPTDFQKESFRTIELAEGVKAVVGHPKAKKSEGIAEVEKAKWTTAYVNDLPDSAFLYIAPGGKKDSENKTVPRSLRYFPIRDDSGKLDLPHLRNAIGRIPQSTAPSLTATDKQKLQDKARALLAEAVGKADRTEQDRLILEVGGIGELPADVKKAVSAHTQLEGLERSLPAVLQLHFRGKAAHGDFRVQTGEGLIGYTLALQLADRLHVSDKAAAAKLARSFAVHGSQWNRALTAPNGVFAALKNVHPAAWLKADNQEFGPGAIGATFDAPGYMFAVARPRVSRGVTTETYHEFFCEKDRRMQGRLVCRHVFAKDEEGGDARIESGRRGSNFWRVMFADDLVPHIVTTKAIRKGCIGPKGWSLLPPQLKAVVPESLRYWEADTEKERKEVRRALVKQRFFTRDTLKLVDGEIRKVVAKYYLYQPEKPVGVGKATDAVDEDPYAPIPYPAPPTASQVIRDSTDGQEKMAVEADVGEGAEKSVAQRLVEAKKRVTLLKYYTVDKSEEGDEEERYVLGEVLVPDEFDAQGDAYTEHYVRKAAHFFMEYGHRLGLMHERTLSDNRVRILESYVAPIDMQIEDRCVKKGTWLLAARIVDDELWAAVKAGKLTGWSIEGTAIAEEIY